jgi:hypothetical protein
MRTAWSIAAAALLLSTTIGHTQTRPKAVRAASEAAPAASEALPTANTDASIAGKWTYRSYRNRADIIVNADAEPAVKNLSGIYGQEVETANSALKALSLVFGEGIMTFDPPSGNAISGNLDMGGGYVLDLKGTIQPSAGTDVLVLEIFGTGRAGTPTENWEYDYKAFTTPKWPNGINQIPAFVGTVIRAKPHGSSPAGVVASFVSIKQ